MKKKAALYDPYLDNLGGGEKHILSILQVLDELGFEIQVFWDKDLSKEIHNKFALQYVNKLKFLPNIFKENKNIIEKLSLLRNFDIFFYVTDGSYFFSSAKKNFVFCMVPNKKLYNINIVNKLKLWNYSFISNSFFTQKWLEKWRIKSQVVFPYVNNEYLSLDLNTVPKENIILSVGRFFPHLHSKQHSLLIDWFSRVQKENTALKPFKLIIAGGFKTEDINYFESLKKQAADNPKIILIPNLNFSILLDLYKRSAVYVHAAGYGIDENRHPELVEHLGIAPLEAMSAGCITFCYNAGGPKEIIRDGQNGYLFSDFTELTEKIKKTIEDEELQKQLMLKAHACVADRFSYDIFKEQVKKIIL